MKFCDEKNIPFHTIAFETEKYASEKGISIQMAARELRYEWFEKIRQENNYKYIATAHHKNDVAETMLINLVKGTGLAGLHGIANKNGNVIRPLLCFKSAEINDYVNENNVPFRKDLSNSDTKYTRNLIRHQIIPELERINPALIETLNIEASQFLDCEKIIADKILDEKSRLFIPVERGFKINISDLKELTPLNSYLYYFLREYGFNLTNVTDIIASFKNQSGKQFYSTSHQITRDREFLILLKIEDRNGAEIVVNSMEELIELGNWKIKKYQNGAKFKIRKDAKYANLDVDTIKFPLTVRNWQQGDVFQPLGMKGFKKLSDFFTDNRFSVPTKHETKILAHNDDIVWVIGYRIDEKYKVTNQTKNILVIDSKPIMY